MTNSSTNPELLHSSEDSNDASVPKEPASPQRHTPGSSDKMENSEKKTGLKSLKKMPSVEIPTPEPPAVQNTLVPPNRQLDAIRHLVVPDDQSGKARAEQFIDFAEANKIDLRNMWVSLDPEGKILGTVLAVPSPGRTALLFTDCITHSNQVRERSALIEFSCKALQSTDVTLAQALLEPRDTILKHAYLAGGFSELAKLSYLERPLPSACNIPAVTWPSDVTVEPYRSDLEDELIAVLENSYEETLDCPGLRGLRQTRDILAGHLGTGEYDPKLWTILRIRGEATGAILLNRSPLSDTFELVYIGLAKAARNRGLGRLLLRYAISLLSDRRERAVTLAVDEKNAPAISLYRREGFRRVLRRIAFINPLSHAPPAPGLHGPTSPPAPATT